MTSTFVKAEQHHAISEPLKSRRSGRWMKSQDAGNFSNDGAVVAVPIQPEHDAHYGFVSELALLPVPVMFPQPG